MAEKHTEETIRSLVHMIKDGDAAGLAAALEDPSTQALLFKREPDRKVVTFDYRTIFRGHSPINLACKFTYPECLRLMLECPGLPQDGEDRSRELYDSLGSACFLRQDRCYPILRTVHPHLTTADCAVILATAVDNLELGVLMTTLERAASIRESVLHVPAKALDVDDGKGEHDDKRVSLLERLTSLRPTAVVSIGRGRTKKTAEGIQAKRTMKALKRAGQACATCDGGAGLLHGLLASSERVQEVLSGLDKSWMLPGTGKRVDLVRWRRAVEAKRDAGMVFQAAREGRPLELARRLRLGALAGGLEETGEVGDTRKKPVEAARLGGHDECVGLLEEAAEAERVRAGRRYRWFAYLDKHADEGL